MNTTHKYWIFAAALCSWWMPSVATAQAPSASTSGRQTSALPFDVLREKWDEVRTLTGEMDDFIARKSLHHVHDAALNVRDAVRDLRESAPILSLEKRDQLDVLIRRFDGDLDALHESADHNDGRATVRGQRQMHLLLDEIAALFGPQMLNSIGPIAAKSDVRDPFCRMMVSPPNAAAKVAHAGQMYYFCDAREATEFQRNPAPYVQIFDDLNWGKPKQFTVSVGANGAIRAGQNANLVFAVREAGQSEIVREFQTVHEKKFHLIATSEDLSWFAHVHPAQGKDGKFTLRMRFPRAGKYFLYSDFTPSSGSNTMARSQIEVLGISRVVRSASTLQPDATLNRNVGGLNFGVQLSSRPEAGKAVLLTYSVSKNGAPVTDLQPYLGAMGHMMAISQNGLHAVHTHTVSAGDDAATGLRVTPEMSTPSGPQQTFKLQLPAGGRYKVWAQFQHENRVLTVPFVFEVKGQTPTTPQMPVKTPLQSAPVSIPRNAQRISISLPDGYKNNAITVTKNRPVALTFHLKSEAGCGNSVALPMANWKRTLKVGERATVVFTPTKSGPLQFACTMGHLNGSLQVK